MTGTHSPHLATTLHSGGIFVTPLNATARNLQADAAASSLARPSDAAACSTDQLPCFVLLDDVWRGTIHLQEMVNSMQRPVYAVSLPQVRRASVFLTCFHVVQGYCSAVVRFGA